MKSQKYFFVILLLSFFFVPLTSSAQFTLTNKPCDVQPLPAGRNNVNDPYSTCSYCFSNNIPLHLSWDLKAHMANPSCSLMAYCVNPDADLCNHWPEYLVDRNGKPKTEFKPTDDVFIKRLGGSAFVPGKDPLFEAYVQCYDKSLPPPVYPNVTPLYYSMAMRVKSECAAAPVGNPCEVPFGDIALGLLSSRPVAITEESGRSWSEIQGSDFCYYTNGVCTSNPVASGDVRDIKDFMINLQKSSNGSLIDDFYQNRSLFILKEAFKAGDIVPIVIDGKMHGHSLYPEGYHIQHALVAYDLTEDGDNVVIKIVDPNDPLKADDSLTCTKKDLSPGYASVTCNKFYFGSAFMDNIVIMVIRNQVDERPLYYRFKERHDSFCLTNTNSNLCKGTARERLLGNWRLSLKNIPDPTIFYGYNDGFCYAWTFTQTSLVYLGDFVGTDYHPNDGKVTGTNCDPVTHYPIGTKKTSSVNSWLASVWSAWQGIFK